MIDTAALLGGYPWAGYALSLVLAAALAAAITAAARPAGNAPSWPLLALPATCAALLALMALMVSPAGGAMLERWDAEAARALQAHADDNLRAASALVSHAGDPPLLWALALGIGAALWWRGERALMFWWALALAGNGLAVRALKALLDRTRPPDADALTAISGASFPSGHASAALVAWGLLGYIALVQARLAQPPLSAYAQPPPSACAQPPPSARARALLWVCASIAFAVGYSRWLLGAHHASDVVAGWLCGGAWLAAAIIGHRWQQAR